MKTLNTLLSLSFLAISTAGFANTDDKAVEKNKIIPVTSCVFGSQEIETPAYISLVPVAPFTLGDSTENVPTELAHVKAKYALVPVAPFIWGDASEEVSIK